MFKFKKAKARNITFIVLSFLLALALIALVEYFLVDLSIKQMIITAIVVAAVFGATLAIMFVIAFIVNKKDKYDRRIAQGEVTSEGTRKILEANGANYSSMQTERSVKEIDADIKRLHNERFHAQSRDENLKKVSKFSD